MHLLPGAAGVGVVGQADCAGGGGAWKWPVWLVAGVAGVVGVFCDIPDT